MPPSPPSLSVCLHPSLTYRLMHILLFFQTHSTAPLTYTVAHTLDQIYTEICRAIFVCSSRCFFACVIFPYISGLEAAGVITSDTVHSGEALRFCLCVTARLDADQGRILANLYDLTQRLFGVLCYSLVLRKEFGSRSRGVQVGYDQGCSG